MITLSFENALVLSYLALFITALFLCRWNIRKKSMRKILMSAWIKLPNGLIMVGVLGLGVVPLEEKLWVSMIFLCTLPSILRWVGACDPPEKLNGIAR